MYQYGSHGQTRNKKKTNLLIDNYIDLHACLGATLQDMVQSPFLVLHRRAPQEELWGEPPVGNVDGLSGFLQGFRNRPHIILCIDIPLYAIAIVDGRKGLKPMGLCALSALTICSLLMLLVMAMVWIYDVKELADPMLEMRGFGFHIVQMGI